MTEITGTLTCHKYARPHHHANLFASLLLDAVRPLPPHTIWTIRVDDDTSPVGDGYRLYRTRSGRLPKSIDPAMEGQTVTVRATLTPWSNGLGGYIANVRQVVSA